MSSSNSESSERTIDAELFQKPLVSLAETLAQKLQREVPRLIVAPVFVSVDLFVMMRQAMYTFNLLCYVNADERRTTDTSWNPAYTFVTAPLVRSMVDILYNMTFILLDPATNGRAFRLAGYKKEFFDLQEDTERYEGKPQWGEYNENKRKMLDQSIRADGITMQELTAAAPWMTMGTYVSNKQKGGILSPHQLFLKNFTHGMWREYSAMSHGGFEGLLDSGVFFTRDAQRHELRPQMDEYFPKVMSFHMMRASLVLLSIVTELQLRFRFSDANITRRLVDIWQILLPAHDAGELFEEHYRALLKQAGMMT